MGVVGFEEEKQGRRRRSDVRVCVVEVKGKKNLKFLCGGTAKAVRVNRFSGRPTFYFFFNAEK